MEGSLGQGISLVLGLVCEHTNLAQNKSVEQGYQLSGFNILKAEPHIPPPPPHTKSLVFL